MKIGSLNSEIFGGTVVTVRQKRGPEKSLRKEFEDEPIVCITPYAKNYCPYTANMELRITGDDVKKLRDMIDWAINGR